MQGGGEMLQELRKVKMGLALALLSLVFGVGCLFRDQ